MLILYLFFAHLSKIPPDIARYFSFIIIISDKYRQEQKLFVKTLLRLVQVIANMNNFELKIIQAFSLT